MSFNVRAHNYSVSWLKKIPYIRLHESNILESFRICLLIHQPKIRVEQCEGSDFDLITGLLLVDLWFTDGIQLLLVKSIFFLSFLDHFFSQTKQNVIKQEWSQMEVMAEHTFQDGSNVPAYDAVWHIVTFKNT